LGCSLSATTDASPIGFIADLLVMDAVLQSGAEFPGKEPHDFHLWSYGLLHDLWLKAGKD
jgi:hypothetical protein